MRPRVVAVLILAFTMALSLSAEGNQAVLRVLPFQGPELAEAELKAIQNLVTSSILELKTFRVIDTDGQDPALSKAETGPSPEDTKDRGAASADFLISGSIIKTAYSLIFSLTATKVSSGEKRSVSETLADQGELILAARRLTRRLFEREEFASTTPQDLEGESSPASPPPETASLRAMPRPYLSALTGSWKGDKGVARVSIFSDGRGFVFLSSGASMKITTRIQDDRIEIFQAQENRPEFYRSEGIDYASAKAIAEQARPWKWIFQLSEDGQTLFGVKETVFVRVDPEGKVSVDNDYVREALWSRLGR